MSASNQVNAGVHASNGFEFQKHCALYVLLQNYTELKHKKYFICLEHHEDFLFCHLTETELVKSIKSFQAKKSSVAWTMEASLFELIGKMCQVGTNLLADTMPKDSSYSHKLYFLSNDEIKLNEGTKKKKQQKLTINYSNDTVRFTDLDPLIGKAITDKITLLTSNAAELSELDKIAFTYIDFPKKTDTQKTSLIGEFTKLFGNHVSDHKAAVDALLLLFRDVENTLNQGSVVKLMDKSKRVTHAQIESTINIITTEKKAYQLWRDKTEEVAQTLSLTVADRRKFELNIHNSFDLFKDLTQMEHQKILKHVEDNVLILSTYSTDVQCIDALYSTFRKIHHSQLLEVDLKAALFSAYIQIKESI